jgi:uncharacterized protein involved in tolerance to divalent cations
MSDKLVVFVSCEGKEQAERIAGALVEARLAACVNVLPGVRSCYTWEEKVKWSEEVLLVVKTTREVFAELEAKILELHTYKLPEVIGVKIEKGSEKYLQWMAESVGRKG